jgi:glycosylphosphatidylinositol deacylase
MGCESDILAFDLNVDWWTTIGRCATRYPTTLATWAVGVVALLMFRAWGTCERAGGSPNVVPPIYENFNLMF